MTARSIVDRGARLLVRLAPEPFRRAHGSAMAADVVEVCLAARRRSGWPALIGTSIAELWNLAGVALRLRLGGRATLTAGPGPSPGRRRGRRPLMPRPMQILHDLRLAVRSLLSARTTAAIAIGTLALGIGVNAAVFSIVDSTLFRPVPFANADRYEELWNADSRSGFLYPGFQRQTFLAWREQVEVFDRVEGYDVTTFIYGASRGAEMLAGAFVTPALMPMLGTPPLAGRALGDADAAGSGAVVVVSEEFWRTELRGEGSAIGRAVTLNDRLYTVVGVMPAAFRFPNGAMNFWVPYDPTAPASADVRQPERLTAFARRAPGVTRAAAADRVKELGAGISASSGEPAHTSATLRLSSALLDRRMERSLYVLGGAVVFLLLIVCANLANLSLARTLARHRDLAIRASLGASRADLVRESLVEHLLVGVAGVVIGLAISGLVIELTVSLLPDGALTRTMNAIDLDWRTLAFTTGAGIFAAVLCGVPPAWLSSRATVADALKGESRGATGSVSTRRMRGALVVVEVALAIVLLAGAALMTRSYLKLNQLDRGFDTAGLATVRVGLPTAGYLDPYARDAFVSALIDRVRQVPGVSAVSAGSVPPETSFISFGEIEFEARPGQMTPTLVLPIYQVWATYFDTVGLALKAGRAFDPDEPRESAIVSESFARTHFGEGGAVGQRFRIGAGTWRTIVGVATEVRQFDLEDAEGGFELYYPLRRPPGVPPAAPRQSLKAIIEYRTIVARATDADAVLGALRRAPHDVDPRVVVWEAASVERSFAAALARPRLVLLMMSVFALMGLVLAAAGIYGVLSYLVVQRHREIGIRLALGAVPASIGRLVLGDGLRLTAIGVAIGVTAALSLVRVMQTLLYEVDATDPLSMSAVVAVLVLTAVFASWRPARWAMRIDPLTLLR